jgi:hypothetical protein
MKDILGETPSIIKQRIKGLGYSSIINMHRDNSLDIIVNDVRDTLLLLQTITRNNKIEFREIYTLDELPNFFTTADMAMDRLISMKGQSPGIYSIISPLIADETKTNLKFPAAIGAINKKDTAVLSQVLRLPILLNSLPADLRFYYGILTDESKLRNNPDDLYLYAIRTKEEEATLENNDIERATVYYPDIAFEFNTNGAAKWARMTRQNTGRYIAIILDGSVIIAPAVYGPIEGGKTTMHTNFTPDEANNLAAQLRTGILPSDLIITRKEISGEPAGRVLNRALVVLIAFILFSVTSFFTFNALKNR